MEFKSYKTVKISETIGLAVNETENQVQILVAPTSMFGGGREVTLTFDEFKQILNALQLLEVERNLFKKPKKKKEE